MTILMTEVIADAVIQNTVYFSIGAVVGFLFSRLLAKAERRAMHCDHKETTVNPVKNERAVRAVIVLLVSGLLFGSGVFAGYRVLQQQFSCVNDYANDLADSLTPRQEATEVYQIKQDDVFNATERLLNGDKTAKADLSKALNDYRIARVELEDQRESNPYPEAPREVCP